jgi:hypothetical protein
MGKIITRADAKAQGLPRYFTGRPCKHGHVVERKTHDRKCVKCIAVNNKAWSDANGRTWRRDKSRAEKAVLGRYAPPPLECDCPPRPADGRCQACGGSGPLMMDHDHETGAFRAWVCAKCNSARERQVRRPGDKLAVEIEYEARRLGIA